MAIVPPGQIAIVSHPIAELWWTVLAGRRADEFLARVRLVRADFISHSVLCPVVLSITILRVSETALTAYEYSYLDGAFSRGAAQGFSAVN